MSSFEIKPGPSAGIRPQRAPVAELVRAGPVRVLTRTRTDLEPVARQVLQSQLLDELEEAELAPSGEVPCQFSAPGHELVQVLLARGLTRPHDAATSYYRSRPLMLAGGLRLTEALAAGRGRRWSPSEGRDVGVVFSIRRAAARQSYRPRATSARD